MEWVTSTQLLKELESSNDGDGWEYFCGFFRPMLIRFAKGLGSPNSLAEDAAQETLQTFIKSFRAGKYDRDKGRLSKWLFGIAFRVIRNMHRKLPREKLIADNQTGTCFWDLIEDENAVKHTWNTEWRKLVLKHCISQARKKFLPDTFKAFEMHSLSEMPTEQVAKKLNISKNAVYIANCRVLKELRQIEQTLLETL